MKRGSNTFGIIFVIIIIAILISTTAISIYSQFNDTTYTIEVVDKERVNYPDSSKYLIYCNDVNDNNVVFENTDCWIRGKFNSSEVYMELEVGKTYVVTVTGFRIPIFSMYQNIINVTEIP